MELGLLIFAILSTVGGLLIAIIGYFLSQSMANMRDVERQTIRNTTAIEVQRERFDAIDNKINEMRIDLKDLINELKKK